MQPEASEDAREDTTNGADELIEQELVSKRKPEQTPAASSNVEIRVRTQFSPLGPNVLGSAGTTFVLIIIRGTPRSAPLGAATSTIPPPKALNP